MAYTPATNAPNKLVDGTIDGTGGPTIWSLNGGGDSDATIKAAGYISDGVTRGMVVGDIVNVNVPGTGVYIHFVLSVTGNAVNLNQTPAALT